MSDTLVGGRKRPLDEWLWALHQDGRFTRTDGTTEAAADAWPRTALFARISR